MISGIRCRISEFKTKGILVLSGFCERRKRADRRGEQVSAGSSSSDHWGLPGSRSLRLEVRCQRWPTPTKSIVPIVLLLFLGCASKVPNYVTVESGPFKAVVTETGELQAVKHMTVPMPPFNWEYGQPKITALAKEGSLVREGDVIGQIETAGVTRALGQKRMDLDIARADYIQVKVQQETELRQLTASILSAEAQWRLAQIGMDRVKFESHSKQEVTTLDLKVAELGLRKARQKLEATQRTQVEDRRIQEAKLRQIQAAIQAAETTLERFTLRAPTAGMVEYWRNGRSGRKIGVGDQVWMGQPIVGLPDLTKMRVITAVDETERPKLLLGQAVEVRLDAFPKNAFKGKVSKISRVSHAKEPNSPIKVFDINVELENADPVLRPGMTVRCEFNIADLNETLFVDPAGVHHRATITSCTSKKHSESVVWK